MIAMDYAKWMEMLKEVADLKVQSLSSEQRREYHRAVMDALHSLTPEQKEGIIASTFFAMMCVSHGDPRPKGIVQ